MTSTSDEAVLTGVPIEDVGAPGPCISPGGGGSGEPGPCISPGSANATADIESTKRLIAKKRVNLLISFLLRNGIAAIFLASVAKNWYSRAHNITVSNRFCYAGVL